MRLHRSPAGFTLLEVLVSIAILGVVTSLGVQMFFGLTNAWRETRRTADLEIATQAALDQMGDTFAAVVSSELIRESVQGERRDISDPRFWDRELANDRIVLPAYRLDSSGIPVRVAFAVDRDELGNSLVRTETPIDEAAGKPVETRLLDEGDVLRLRFEYADRATGEWRDNWTGPEMPAAVRVSIAVAYREPIPVPGVPKTQIARKAVFPIRVN